ncbi:uncharacterized protein LOC134097376 [Sardina pilchardus]|uniref:uncharacterized protein LOC134097376 n=1 Tax=Sardina pilchardus TaxID=27697 RepID=UPI002E139F50
MVTQGGLTLDYITSLVLGTQNLVVYVTRFLVPAFPAEEGTGVFGRIGSWFSPWRVRGRETSLEDEPQPRAPIPGQGEHLERPPENQENGTEGEEEEESQKKSEEIEENHRNATDKIHTRRNLQVYLEETSVTQDDITPVVETTIKKTFQVVSKATRAKQQREVINDDDDDSNMGRKNSGRRRSRKGSRGDPTSPRQKTPPTKNTPGQPPTSPEQAWEEARQDKGVSALTMTSPKAKDTKGAGAESDMGEEPEDTRTQPASPETVHDPHTHTPAVHRGSLDFEGPVLATLATVEMDTDEDDDGRVERKTETPESKRRSIKVSRSERVFAKKFVVNSEPAMEEQEDKQTDRKRTVDLKANGRQVATVTLKKGEAALGDGRPDEKSAAIRTIVNRIKLFENHGGAPGPVKATHPRSADVSPARSVADRVKMLDQSSGQRSLSADRVNASPKVQTVRERAKNFTHTAEPTAASRGEANETRPSRLRNARPQNKHADGVREATHQQPGTFKNAEYPPDPPVAQSQPVIRGKSSAVSSVTNAQSEVNTPAEPGPEPVKLEQVPVTKPRGKDQPDAAMPGDTPTRPTQTLTTYVKDTPPARVSPDDKKSTDSYNDKESSQTRASLQTKDNAHTEADQLKLTNSDQTSTKDTPERQDKDSQIKDRLKTKDTSDTNHILIATDNSQRENRVTNKKTKEDSQVSTETIDTMESKDSILVKADDSLPVKDTITKETITRNDGSQAKNVIETKDTTQSKDTLTYNSDPANEQVKLPETKQVLITNNSPEVLKNKDSPQTKDAKMLTNDAMNLKDSMQNKANHLTRDDTTTDKRSEAPRTKISPKTNNFLTPEICHLNDTKQDEFPRPPAPQANDQTEMKEGSPVRLGITSTEHPVNEDKLNISGSVVSTDVITNMGLPKGGIHQNTPESSPEVENKEISEHQSSATENKHKITTSNQEVKTKTELSSPSASDTVVKGPPEVKGRSVNQSMTSDIKTQSTNNTPIPASEPSGETVSAVVDEKAKSGDIEHTGVKHKVAETETVKEEVKVVSPAASEEQVVSAANTKSVEKMGEDRKSVPEQLTGAITEATKDVPEQSTEARSKETVVPEQSTEDSKKTEAKSEKTEIVSSPTLNSNVSTAEKLEDQAPYIHISRSTFTPEKKRKIGQVATEVPDRVKVDSEDPSQVTTEQLPSKGTTVMSTGADTTKESLQNVVPKTTGTGTTKETLQNVVSKTTGTDTKKETLQNVVSKTTGTDTTKESLQSVVSKTTGTDTTKETLQNVVSKTKAIEADTPSAGITVNQETKSTLHSGEVESAKGLITPSGKSEEKASPLSSMDNEKAAKSLNESSGTNTTAEVNCETPSQKVSKDSTSPGTTEETSSLSNQAKEKSSSLTSLTNEDHFSLSGGSLGKATPDSSAVMDSTRKKNKPILKGLKLRDFPLPSRDAPSRDSPSSWLDLDFRPTPKPRQPLRSPKLSASVSNLDASGELEPQDFMERVKKLAIPFNVPPRNNKLKKTFRTPAPSFAMPAIKEDRYEKTFDPDEFKFGQRKRHEFSLDLSKLREQVSAEKEPLEEKLKKAHLDRGSILVKSLLLRETEAAKGLVGEEEGGKAGEKEGDGEGKGRIIKSRLEGSSILSSLRTTGRISRLSLFSHKGDTGSEPLSPIESLSPNSPMAAVTTPNDPAKTILDLRSQRGTAEVNKNPTETTMDSSNLSKSLEDDKKASLISNDRYSLNQSKDSTIRTDPYSLNQPTMPEVNNKLTQSNQSETQINQTEPRSASATTIESGPLFPSFDDIKFPGHLQELFPQNHGKVDPLRKINSEVTSAPSQPPEMTPIRPLQDQTMIMAANGSHRRPGKMVLFEQPQFKGQSYEVFRDVPDATALKLSAVISAKIIRGCWVLYEEIGFKGRSIALEEGPVELNNVWAEEGQVPCPAMVIGSIRLAVRDYTIPRIDLFPETDGRGMHTTYLGVTPQLASYGFSQSTGSIKVHSGVWLVFSEEQFQGYHGVLEVGEFPAPQTWGFPIPVVGSLRPLQMGGLKVENPTEAKALLYERAGLQGPCVEIHGDVLDVSKGPEPTHTPLNPHVRTHTNSDTLKTVGSMKILSGLWVGYEGVGFEGRQYVLEEGEYLDWQDWGGASEWLLSLRPVLVDPVAPHLKMNSERDFSDRGGHIDLMGAVPNTQLTGYGFTTQSIDVLSGVWVVFEEVDFCGQHYVVEKGQYAGPEDWGAQNSTISAAMPVFLDDFSGSSKFKVELYSEPELSGPVLVLDDSVSALPADFKLQSCKVLSGSWLACEREEYLGSVCVLEEGVYPDVRAMGFQPNIAVRSLLTTGFEFSLPSITLCERADLRGRRVVLMAGSVNLQLTGGCSRTHSVMVQGGMWVLYEGVNFRGAQVLLRPGMVPDWLKLTGWQRIGSLRPLLQKPVNFRLRNHETGLFLSITGALEDIKLMRIQATAETGGAEQVWTYQDGHLQCKNQMLEDCCVEPLGSLIRPGARLCMTAEKGKPDQQWNITPDGLIRSNVSSDLVFEVKGGEQYDKHHVVLNAFDQSKLNQRWSLEFV